MSETPEARGPETPRAGHPERIGPYRVDGRLGQGGMGTVYRGYDERLDRPVALKQIRPEVAADEKSRARFRREARAAAQLNHSHVVQIYDLVETVEDPSGATSDWLVMELVEGQPLSEILRDGPLTPERAVPLVREIVEGLAAAHGKSLVHRDLKAENVMITEDGHAKILDFGLVKPLQAALSGSTAPLSDASLTVEGKVMGTVRSMSPEQALSRPVDARSDLFSLGTLLYEMLTGKSPFEGQSEVETLTRICSQPHPQVTQENPTVPRELAMLVDHLLQKEPALRPSSAMEVSSSLRRIENRITGEHPGMDAEPTRDLPFDETLRDMAWVGEEKQASETSGGALPRRRIAAAAGAGVLVVVGALWIFSGFPGIPDGVAVTDPVRVVVPRPAVSTSDPGEEVELLAAGARVELLRGLLDLEGVAPVTLPELRRVEALSAEEIPRAVAADEVLVATFDCTSELCLLTLRRESAREGELIWAGEQRIPMSGFGLLRRSVGSMTRQAYPERRTRSGSRVPDPVDAEIYARFVELWRRFFELRDPALSEILTDLDALQARAPGFADLFLLEADVARQRYFEASRDPADLDRALAAVETARDLTPEEPAVLSRLALIALAAGDLERTEKAVERLEAEAPGQPETLARRAQLLERQGDPAEAMERLAEAVRLYPSVAILQFNLANLQQRKGRGQEGLETVRRLVERWPDYVLGWSLQAKLELQYGQVERAADLYERLIAVRAGPVELSNLASAYLLLRDYPTAASTALRAVEQAPTNPAYLLNLADAELLAGREEQAASIYRRVLEAAGTEMAAIRAQAHAHLGEAEVADRLIQQALGETTVLVEQTHYEAAVVYAVLGNRSFAAYHATRALEGGYAPRWFAFPWFEEVLQDPNLAPWFPAEAQPSGKQVTVG